MIHTEFILKVVFGLPGSKETQSEDSEFLLKHGKVIIIVPPCKIGWLGMELNVRSETAPLIVEELARFTAKIIHVNTL